MSKVCISSLNIRVASNAEEHEQGIREPRIISFLQRNKPNSIGTQECTAFWRERLDERMKEIGYKRAQNTPPIRDTFKNYIWYQTETTDLVDAGFCWLSETPDEPSKGFGSRYYISASWAVLRLKADGTEYVHVNTHLDFFEEETRKEELELLLSIVKRFTDKGYEVLVTGDFNSRENSCIYERIASLMSDARKTAKYSTTINTYNGYQDIVDHYRYDVPQSEYIRIDYCFHTERIEAEQFQVIERWDGGYMSDHNALLIQLEIK